MIEMCKWYRPTRKCAYKESCSQQLMSDKTKCCSYLYYSKQLEEDVKYWKNRYNSLSNQIREIINEQVCTGEKLYNLYELNESLNYLPYDTEKCPICGGKIKHPYTGSVTLEQIEEDSICCLLTEVCDEAGSCLGYIPICRGKDETK